MTIIAYKDGLLAADTLAVGLGKEYDCRKVFYKAGVGAVAVCGEGLFARAAANWIFNGCTDPKPVSNDDNYWTAIFLRRDGELFSVSCETPVVKLDRNKFYAEGSGAENAFTAMHLGQEAIGAVEVAKELNIYCGGETSWYCAGSDTHTNCIEDNCYNDLININNLNEENND